MNSKTSVRHRKSQKTDYFQKVSEREIQKTSKN